MPVNYKDFPLWIVKAQTIPRPMWPLMISSQVFPPILANHYSPEDLKRILCKSPQHSPCSSLLPGTWSCEFYLPWPPCSHTSFSSTQGDYWVILGPPPSRCVTAGNSLQAVNLGNHRVYLVSSCLSEVTVLWHLIPNAWKPWFAFKPFCLFLKLFQSGG